MTVAETRLLRDLAKDMVRPSDPVIVFPLNEYEEDFLGGLIDALTEALGN